MQPAQAWRAWTAQGAQGPWQLLASQAAQQPVHTAGFTTAASSCWRPAPVRRTPPPPQPPPPPSLLPLQMRGASQAAHQPPPSDGEAELDGDGTDGVVLYRVPATAAIGAFSLGVRDTTPQPTQAAVDIRAYHIGGEIDVQTLCRSTGNVEQHLGRDHVVIRGEDMTDDTVLLGAGRRDAPENQRLVVVYRFGSVIFFGGQPEGDVGWVRRAQAHAKEPLTEPLTDHSTVIVRSAMTNWFALEPDRIVVRSLDLGNVRVISNILGQSVALDHYNRRVDQAIDTFTPILEEIASSGESGHAQSKALLRLIGDNALLYTAVVTRLGLLDMTDTAWRNDRYFGLWASLRADYEIERRFEALRGKLGPMIENAKFILEVREDKKSERSEFIIILLIAVEILVSALHHVL